MSAEITSIRGINNFSNLTTLEIDNHDLTELDVSGLSNLVTLDCSDNKTSGTPGISTLNLTGCTSLELLYIDDNDFSAGFPDLSDCTSLVYFDADQCNIQGTLDLSNLPDLEGFDLYGNENLTNLSVSSTQALGQNYNILLDNTGLTQSSIDGVLHACASGSVVNGVLECDGATTSYPSEYGVEAIRVLNGRGWSISVKSYSNSLILTPMETTSGDACNSISTNNLNDPGGYVHKDTPIGVGTYLYDDSLLLTPKANGWYGYPTGSIAYQVVGGNGYISSSVEC